MPDFHFRHITQAIDPGTVHLDHQLRQLLDAVDAPLGAHHQVVVALGQPSGSHIEVVVAYDLFQFGQVDTGLCQARREGRDLVGLGEAAQHVDIGDALHRAQRRANFPIQQVPPLQQRQLRVFHGEHEHLAERRAHGRHPAADTRGQAVAHIGKALVDLLPGPVDIRALAKIQGDVGDGVLGGGAQHLLVGNTQQLCFDHLGDLLLHLFRCHARRLEDDFHLGGRDVGEGVYRQLQPGPQAQHHDRQGENTDEQPLGQGKADEFMQHLLASQAKQHALHRAYR